MLLTPVSFTTASVDGKSAKQINDADGNPILMLNVFAHTLKVHLASWSVKGDKTNEPGCLKKTIRPWGKEPVVSLHFYINSLDPDQTSPERYQELILQHWEIENCLHGQKDRFYGEDKHACGEDWGGVWTVLTSMALSLAKLMKKRRKNAQGNKREGGNQTERNGDENRIQKKTC